MAKAHKHKMVFSSHGGKPMMLGFNCSCGLRIERPSTKREENWLKQDWNLLNKRAAIMHALGWDFQKRFIKPDRTFKYTGYDLICRMERWAAKNPTVRECSVDDDIHAGARLFFIPHETSDEYWGTTVVYVYQFGPPTQFFLYPDHWDDLLPILKEIKSRTFKKNGRGERSGLTQETDISFDPKFSSRGKKH